MPNNPLRVAMLGGIPASLGGGGLEIQRDSTAKALRALGHDVFDVAACADPKRFDVLHVFGSEVDAWHVTGHWRRNRTPLVISPIIVVAPGAERRFIYGSRLRRPKSIQRMRVELLRRANLLIALTDHERDLLDRLAPTVQSVVIGNGVAPDLQPLPVEVALPDGLGSFVLLVGTVSPRKRQQETVTALGSAGIVPVIVGGFQGSDAERHEFEDAVERARGMWLGEQSPSSVRWLMRRAKAMVHMSQAEGQSLAILESLAEATPVVCSDLPVHRELAATHPGWLAICRKPAELAASIRAISPPPNESPLVPSWDDVARRLVDQYRVLLASAM